MSIYPYTSLVHIITRIRYLIYRAYCPFLIKSATFSAKASVEKLAHQYRTTNNLIYGNRLTDGTLRVSWGKHREWRCIHNAHALNTIHPSVAIENSHGITLESHFASAGRVPDGLEAVFDHLFMKLVSLFLLQKKVMICTSRICSSVWTSIPGKYSFPMTVCCMNLLAHACRTRLYAAIATCWSVGDWRAGVLMIGRSFVSADLRVTLPRDCGATRVARIVP